MNSPADDKQPAIPTYGDWQPVPAAAPGSADVPLRLTSTQKTLVGVVTGGVVTIATIGFVGSYAAVTRLAARKGFGWFAYAFPTGIDAGIVVYLALDLLLTWLRMPYGLLRQIAWALTAATIAFNAAAAWPDWLGVGMHAAIPILFIGAVEAARHAVGRIANIVADRHIESPPLIRWFVAFPSTFRIWRRMRLWQLRSYQEVIDRQRELTMFRTQLRSRYGRRYMQHATATELLALRLARFGVSVSETLATPEVEAEVKRKAEAAQQAEAKRQAEAEAEARRAEEAKRAETERARKLAEAETAARLAEVEGQMLTVQAKAEAERRRILDEQRKAEAEAELARRREAEETARRAAEAEREALRLAQERKRLEDEALRKAEERQRLEAQRRAETEAASRAKPKPETEAAQPETEATRRPKRATEPKPKPTQLGGKRAQIEAEVETLLALMQTEGHDAVDLKRAIDELGLKQTTAYDRLLKAQARWADREAEAS
ncbi:DUF2637 domain-containing protein [Streptomyces sp. NPDC054933]